MNGFKIRSACAFLSLAMGFFSAGAASAAGGAAMSAARAPAIGASRASPQIASTPRQAHRAFRPVRHGFGAGGWPSTFPFDTGSRVSIQSETVFETQRDDLRTIERPRVQTGILRPPVADPVIYRIGGPRSRPSVQTILIEARNWQRVPR